MKYPTRAEAEAILKTAYEKDPNTWLTHCRNTARAAEAIAEKSGLDAEKAYFCGLFHDIGYSEFKNGKGKSCHIILGYNMMKEHGYDELARICLTHSFTYRDIKGYGGSDLGYCDADEIAFIEAFLSDAVYDEYDKLIQLCDSLGTADGIMAMEERWVGVVMRHGFHVLTIEKWAATYEIKHHFDRLCGTNIYNLFREEISASVFK